MTVEHPQIATDVHALAADLLPVLVPGAQLRSDPQAVVLPLGAARATVSTAELVDRCAHAPQHRWPRMVDGWLRQVGAEARTAVTESRAPGDPHDRLRVVLKHRDEVRASDDELSRVTVPFGDYFLVCVVLDVGEPRPLTKLRAGLLDLNDVGERAVRNTLDVELPSLPVQVQQLTLREHATVVTLPGSPYVSAGLMDVRRFLPDDCPYGALVGVPRASMLILHTIESDAALRFVPEFAEIVREMHDTAGDACSHRTYWWADDALLEVELRPGDDEQPESRVVVPPSLVELARRLPPATSR